jgi:hypothetical protein
MISSVPSEHLLLSLYFLIGIVFWISNYYYHALASGLSFIGDNGELGFYIVLNLKNFLGLEGNYVS